MGRHEEKVNKITDRIYVGDWGDALSLIWPNGNWISAVLNVCENMDNSFDNHIAYLHEPFPDHLLIPKEAFDTCMHWLKTQYVLGKNILIHCALGVSRSPTICAAFLVKQGLAKTIDEGLLIVKLARPEVNPAPLTFLSAREYLKNG
jgi:diacylglycerol kinase (ATP)